jgi:predicted NBD/HSP70 family sugar kinase
MYVHPAHLRLGNARRVFAALMSGWPCSRPELARRTGLSAMTVGKVADQLIALGVLDEQSALAPPSLGRPPRQLSPSRRLRYVAIELGVKTSLVCRIGLAGEPVPPQRAFIAADDAATFLREVARARTELGSDGVEAVLVSVPGVLDAQQPSVVFSPNLHWTEGTKVLEGIAALFGVPVCPVQEVQALALGHQVTAEAPEHFLMIELADGVGGTVVTQGRLLGGPMPLSGEIGHTPVPGNDRVCGCGAVGCLETLAGVKGLLASHRDAIGDPAATWADFAEHLRTNGMPGWLLGTIDALAIVAAGALNLVGLRDVVVVGELGHLHPGVVVELQRRLMAHALIGRFGRVECRVAPSQKLAGLLVAAMDRLLLPEPRVPLSLGQAEEAAG